MPPKRRALVPLLVFAAALASPSPARAQTPTEPPPPLPPAAPRPVQTAPIVAAPPDALVVVHVESPEPVDVEVQEHGAWTTVCTSPCDRPLSTKESYRINGAGVRASLPFKVSPGSTARLEVEPHSSAVHAVGIVVTVTGGVGIVPAIGVTAGLVGGLLVGFIIICPLVDAFSRTSFGGCLGDIASEIGKYYGKPYVWIPGVAGLAMVAGGGAMLATTPRTKVQVQNPSAPPPGGGQPILRRTPEWRDARAALPDPAPPFVVPILHGAF